MVDDLNEPDDAAEPLLNVLIVDDHGVVRRGMHAYLAMIPDIEVVGEAADGQQALHRLQTLAQAGQLPDVVLMDLLMPRMDGIAATAAIKARYPQIEVVVLTSFIEETRVQAALEAGATGYLLKDAEADEVAAAIRAAYRGEMRLAPAIATRLMHALRAPKQADPFAELTEREREVLILVANGQANKEIALELGISERTASTHVSNILSKLGLASRTQAALFAVREGLVSPPPL
jgi:DNA-binding NarL/FixJ family response regulator